MAGTVGAGSPERGGRSWPARDGLPAWLGKDDFDGLGEDAWLAAMESLTEPEPGAPLGDDLADTGDEGGPVLGFGPGDAGESMAPGVSLGMLAEHAVVGGSLPVMSDFEVVGLIAAARRLRRRAEWLELRGTREFARRRWEASASPVRDDSGRWLASNSDAEHAADELAFELKDSRVAAEDRMELSLALRDRLPRLDALLAAGRLDERRVAGVRDITSGLDDEQARRVDELLEPDAPDLPYTALRKRAAKLAVSLSPESEARRKRRATRRKARVEKFQERSGNYALAGRELPVEEALASEEYIRALAAHLRSHGVDLGQREAELACYLDLTQGRDPLDRIPVGRRGPAETGPQPAPRANGTAGNSAREDGGCRHGDGDEGHGQDGASDQRPGTEASGDPDPGHGQDRASDQRPGTEASGDPDPGGCPDSGEPEFRRDGRREDADWQPGQWDDYDDFDDDEDGDGGNDGGPWPFGPPGPGRSGGRAPFAASINLRAPFAASINLLVPVGTAFGWSGMPGEAGRDVIDPQTLREMTRAASRHPATRWCVTLTGEDGTAVAHGCARGRHTWDPPPDRGSEHLAEFLARLKVTFEPIAQAACDHQHAEPRYRASRKLRHLIMARDATCPAPGCGASSRHSDMDHTDPWPQGPTDECNLGAPCRHHHRTKQAPGWTLDQPQPGVFRWTTPSGRVHETRPTRYDV